VGGHSRSCENWVMVIMHRHFWYRTRVRFGRGGVGFKRYKAAETRRPSPTIVRQPNLHEGRDDPMCTTGCGPRGAS